MHLLFLRGHELGGGTAATTALIFYLIFSFLFETFKNALYHEIS